MKGISPLIASVLLMAFVIAVGMLVMGWMSTLTRTTTATVTNKTTEAVDCSAAAISIDAVYLVTSVTGAATDYNGTVRAIVKNTGYMNDLNIISAQAYSNIGRNFTGANSAGVSLPITDLDKGEVETILFNDAEMPACANFSRVVIATNCGGVTDTYTGTPKGC